MTGALPLGGPMVLLHGWGLHAGVFTPLINALPLGRDVLALDLPGHGAERESEAFATIDELADAIASQLPARSTLVGWSLGGQVALELAARRDPRVARLVVVCSTPRFVATDGWDHGLAPAVVDGFGDDLQRDYRRTVQDFLALQVRGDSAQRETLRQLRALVFARGEPTPAALAAGLAVLRNTDIRQRLPKIAVPTLVVSGRRDRLTPPGAGEYIAAHVARAEHRLLDTAHAPFLSHRDEFLATLEGWLAGTAAR